MLALLSLWAKSECLVDCTRAGSMDDNELVGAFEFESAEWGDCAGEAPPFVCPSKLLLLWLLLLFVDPEFKFAPCPVEERFVASLCIE